MATCCVDVLLVEPFRWNPSSPPGCSGGSEAVEQHLKSARRREIFRVPLDAHTEGATVAFERQHLAALISQAREHLAAIDAAVRKIDSGKYEICDKCGGPIGAERLAARPSAVTCVNCARTRR